jgi:hypothetical protein
MTMEPITGAGAISAAEWVDAETLMRVPRTPGLIGESAALQAVSAAIERVAPRYEVMDGE